jgi:ketosteroid isomerase-like protein
MASQSENERNKAVVDEYYKAGVQGHLTSFAAYLHSDFTVTAPNYLPWGGRHVGAAFFRDHLLPGVTDVFDFARFSYDNVIAEDGHVVAVFNIGLTGTDAIIKIVDHWTLRDGKAISLWAANFEPQAMLENLGIKLPVDGEMFTHGFSQAKTQHVRRYAHAHAQLLHHGAEHPVCAAHRLSGFQSRVAVPVSRVIRKARHAVPERMTSAQQEIVAFDKRVYASVGSEQERNYV